MQARTRPIPEQPVKVGQSLKAVRNRLPVDHDALEWECVHGCGDCHELTNPARCDSTDVPCRRP
jgi:hypothetical protein